MKQAISETRLNESILTIFFERKWENIMNKGILALHKIYPDGVVTNLSKNHELYCLLSLEADAEKKTVKEYVQNLGFIYGEDATIISLENKINEVLYESETTKITASFLREKNVYDKLTRVTSFYGISRKDYLKEKGFEYEKNNYFESSVDKKGAQILYEKYGLTDEEIGNISGVTKQRISSILNDPNFNNLNHWQVFKINKQEQEIFEYMVNNHVFEIELDNTTYHIFNNENGEVCLVWHNDEQVCLLQNNNIGKDLLKKIKSEKMNIFDPDDFEVLEECNVVMVSKEPWMECLNQKKYKRVAKKHKLTNNEYAKFLGYGGYKTKKHKSDLEIIKFLEDNLLEENKVYISSEKRNQWIRSLASRKGFTLEKFVELYGYEKADRGTFASLEEYIEKEKEKLKVELSTIASDGVVKPDINLYQRLRGFAKKRNMTIDELIAELGFLRDKYARRKQDEGSEILVLNQLEELRQNLEKAMSLQKNYSESENIEIERKRRNRALVERLKVIYGGRCQVCSEEEWIPIENTDGKYYSEVHHIIPLAEDNEEETLDKLDNMIVVCPTHHRMLHYHHGGLRQILKDGQGYYFTNDSNDRLPIRINYHLKEMNIKN